MLKDKVQKMSMEHLPALRGAGANRRMSTEIYNTCTGEWRDGPVVPTRFDFSRLTI